jgi:GDPmannose 4,6-dehydratase
MTKRTKKAIIVGSRGQDGTLLSQYLRKNNYQITGIDTNSNVAVTNADQVAGLIKELKPDELYYLAAFHQSSQDKPIDQTVLYTRSYEVNVFGYINFLEALRKHSPGSKIFYAASSMIFGNAVKEEQTENSPYSPNTPYGITKLDGMLISKSYREHYGLFASCGILFNHESELRPANFITTKLIQGAIDIKRGTKTNLEVGSLSAKVDWGYAYDYVEAMAAILNLQNPDDFIIATNKLHSIADLAQVAFTYLGLDWKKYVVENANVLTRQKTAIRGNFAKLTNQTHWTPSVSFKEMVKRIIDKRLSAQTGVL